MLAKLMMSAILVLSFQSVAVAEDFYWSGKNYGRGVGTVPGSNCAGKEMDSGLCYEPCRTGYHGVGPVCYLSGQPSSYGRGAGTVPHLDKHMKSVCDGGKSKEGGLCYSDCRSGYHGNGPVCYSDSSPSYGRGAGSIPKTECSSDKEMDAGLCYPKCRDGYHGSGPVCWGNKPAGMELCGAGFAKSSSVCASIIEAQTVSVLQLFGSTVVPGFSKLIEARKASMAEKDLAEAEKAESIFGKLFAKLKTTLQPLKDASKPATEVVENLKTELKTILTPEVQAQIKALKFEWAAGNAALDLSKEDQMIDVVRNLANVMSVYDTIGLTSVIAAYTYPSLK